MILLKKIFKMNPITLIDVMKLSNSKKSDINYLYSLILILDIKISKFKSYNGILKNKIFNELKVKKIKKTIQK